MSNCLPCARDSTDLHQIPEEACKNDRDLGEVVSVDIDIREQADQSGGASEDGPVPLPSATDGMESFLGRQVKSSMFVQGDQSQDQTEAECDCET